MASTDNVSSTNHSAKVGSDSYESMPTLIDTDAKRQQDILADQDAWAAYYFAKDVPGADIHALQQIVLECGEGAVAYLFAKDVTSANIKALQRVILERGNGLDAYYFAKSIPDADIQALQQVLLERGDGWYCCYDAYRFAKDIPGADLPALHNRLVELNSAGKDTKEYLHTFNSDPDIQARLKKYIAVDGQLEHEGNPHHKKNKAS